MCVSMGERWCTDYDGCEALGGVKHGWVWSVRGWVTAQAIAHRIEIPK